MSNAEFNFPNTCPKIDRALTEVEQGLEKAISDLLEEACPFLDSRSLIRISEEKVKDFMKLVSPGFETVRELNSEMRYAAEVQIESLFEELNSLKAAASESSAMTM